MKVSISRSVGRAFDVMEIFRETRKPATATQIRQRLSCPHSSVVAVLYNLVDLGYLSYEVKTHLYFPTGKLSSLGNWVQPALNGSGKIHYVADLVALETGQSVAITSRNSIFLNIIYVRRGSHPEAERLSPGLGVSLARSIPGLALLAQMRDDEICDTVARINAWSRKANADQGRDLQETLDAVAAVREDGAAIGFDWSFTGTGAIAMPLRSPFEGNLLAISTTGPTQLIRPRAHMIRDVLEHYVRLHETSARQPWPRCPLPETIERRPPQHRARPSANRVAASRA